MFSKKFIAFLFIGLFLTVSIGATAAADNTTEDLNEGEKTFTDIQNQINEADENDTIELEGTYTSQGKEIQIDKSITITSKNGATLNAKSKSGIFNIDNATVNLNNLNIINSKSSTNPAIYSNGNLTVSNSTFKNNIVHIEQTYYYFDSEYDTINHTAGAIYSTNSLEIINSTFQENFATRNAYEHEYFEYYIIPWGGSIYSTGNLTIKKTRFKQDSIDSHGNLHILDSEFITSPLYCYSDSSIMNSTFSKIEAYSSAITATSNMTISGCNFTKNGGYAIQAYYKTIIENCNFLDNNLESAGFDYEDFEDEFPAIYIESGDVYVYCSNFANNAGGVISNYWGNVYVENSTFTKNTGGAIDAYNATVINSTFKNNYARFAGAISAQTLLLENCEFINNNEGAICFKESAIINNKTYSGKQYMDNSLNKLKVITATTKKITTTYHSGKNVWARFIYTESMHPYTLEFIDIKITKGKKVTYEGVRSNSKGIANFKASNMPVGTYKIIFYYGDDNSEKITTTVKITKAKTIVKAPKVTAKFKKTKYFKISVKNKATKKAVKNLKIKVKVYTGKKYKIYTIKTDKKGIAKLNTKKLKIRKHKVIASSGNPNYQLSAKSAIVIKR